MTEPERFRSSQRGKMSHGTVKKEHSTNHESDIDEMMERFRASPDLLNPVSRMMLKE